MDLLLQGQIPNHNNNNNNNNNHNHNNNNNNNNKHDDMVIRVSGWLGYRYKLSWSGFEGMRG